MFDHQGALHLGGSRSSLLLKAGLVFSLQLLLLKLLDQAERSPIAAKVVVVF